MVPAPAPSPAVVQRLVAVAVLLGLGLYVVSRLVIVGRRRGKRTTTFRHKLALRELSGRCLDDDRPPGGATGANGDGEPKVEPELRDETPDSTTSGEGCSDRAEQQSVTATASNGSDATPTPEVDVTDDDESDSDEDDEWSFWKPVPSLVIWNTSANVEPEVLSAVVLRQEVGGDPTPEVEERRWGRRLSSMDTIQEAEESEDDEQGGEETASPPSSPSLDNSSTDSDGVYGALYTTATTPRSTRPLEEITDDVLADLQDDPDFRSLVDFDDEDEDEITDKAEATESEDDDATDRAEEEAIIQLEGDEMVKSGETVTEDALGKPEVSETVEEAQIPEVGGRQENAETFEETKILDAAELKPVVPEKPKELDEMEVTSTEPKATADAEPKKSASAEEEAEPTTNDYSCAAAKKTKTVGRTLNLALQFRIQDPADAISSYASSMSHDILQMALRAGDRIQNGGDDGTKQPAQKQNGQRTRRRRRRRVVRFGGPCHPRHINQISVKSNTKKRVNRKNKDGHQQPVPVDQSTQTDSSIERSPSSRRSNGSAVRAIMKKLTLGGGMTTTLLSNRKWNMGAKLKKTAKQYSGTERRRRRWSSERTDHYDVIPSRVAFVTVAIDDAEAAGALVLACSLCRVANSVERVPEVVLLLGDGVVSDRLRQLLSNVYDHVFLTSDLYSHDDLALQLLGRPELATTFTKLHCWRLTQYAKCVYLDADTLVLQNCDELFDREELSAAPDTGWPDCFNSGVFVFRPSLETYSRLVSLAATKGGSFDGGDQGLLNTYFGGRWRTDLSKRLPFIYNVVTSLSYTYAPAYKHYASTVKIVHFLGSEKPWAAQWHNQSGDPGSGPHLPVLHRWIQLFRNKVLPKLPQIAKDEASATPYVSVLHLLHQINSRREECPKSAARDDLVREYFPSQPIADTWPPYHRAPSPITHHHSSEPPPEHHHSSEPPPEHHHSSEPPPEYHHSSEPPPEHHQESSNQTNEHNPPSHEWRGGWQDDHHHHHEESSQPADPHWEALLWHAVQTPWEPPAPPSPDQYDGSAGDPWRQPEEQAEMTFGWFSSDTGSRDDAGPAATTSADPLQSLPDAGSDYVPEVEEAGSVAEQPPESLEQSILRMKSWEEGQIDYLGRDRFENIWKRIESKLQDVDDTGTDDDDEEEEEVGKIAAVEQSDPSETLAQAASNLLLDSSGGGGGGDGTLLQQESTLKEVDEEGAVGGLVGAPSDTVSEAGSSIYPENDFSGMYAWQEGNADYCGRDGSDNIMRHLDRIISGAAKRKS